MRSRRSSRRSWVRIVTITIPFPRSAGRFRSLPRAGASRTSRRPRPQPTPSPTAPRSGFLLTSVRRWRGIRTRDSWVNGPVLYQSELAIHGAPGVSIRIRTRDGTRSSNSTSRRSARVSTPLPPVQRRDGQSSALQGREIKFLQKKQKSLPKGTPRKALARNACDSTSYRCIAPFKLPPRRLPGVFGCVMESSLARCISVPLVSVRKRTRSIWDS